MVSSRRGSSSTDRGRIGREQGHQEEQKEEVSSSLRESQIDTEQGDTSRVAPIPPATARRTSRLESLKTQQGQQHHLEPQPSPPSDPWRGRLTRPALTARSDDSMYKSTSRSVTSSFSDLCCSSRSRGGQTSRRRLLRAERGQEPPPSSHHGGGDMYQVLLPTASGQHGQSTYERFKAKERQIRNIKDPLERSFVINKGIHAGMFAPLPLVTTSQELLPAWDARFYRAHRELPEEYGFRRKAGFFTTYIRHAITKNINLRTTGHG